MLPEPLGQHIFHARAHLGALMERGVVRVSVGQQIVPGEQRSPRRLDRLADLLEAGRAAGRDIVELDHRRPRPLPLVGAMEMIVPLARIEGVGMGAELLPHGVASALDRLAEARVVEPHRSSRIYPYGRTGC